MRTSSPFLSLRTEGGLLPADLLARVAEGDAALPGTSAESYGLAPSERTGEAIARAWNRLSGLWAAFKTQRAALDARPEQRGTTETRENWLLPLFQELGYGRLPKRSFELNGKAYPVSHGHGHLPVHLLAYKVDLDRRTQGVAGASAFAPHTTLQELLNRSEQHLWGLLTNGLKLRLLRDSVSLTRQAYVEFDLELIFDAGLYADFALLWRTLHASRFEGDAPDACLVEQWTVEARQTGTRALDTLRDGVQRAIERLGAGFIAHPDNEALRAALRSGALPAQDYYRQLLRLVYRLIFLFTAEDRDALLDPAATPASRERYLRYYSTAALRTLAAKRTGSPRHGDRWMALSLVMRALAKDGESRLALPALGSMLWQEEAVPDLANAALANAPLLDAVRALAFVTQNNVRRPVAYKHLGPEELGGIYESLLELRPDIHLDARTFALVAVAGSERKTTGSYYTPESLTQTLLDSALNPVLARAEAAPDPEAALLNLKVCDPACGSGHFLIAAAHRIAHRLARLRAAREDDGAPTPRHVQRALREVIARCIYGVDLNPMALELCKVNLWLEALEPGKPLSFLDHHLRLGNALLGATPQGLKDGIPDEAFSVLTCDEKPAADGFKRRNRQFHRMQVPDMFAGSDAPSRQHDYLSSEMGQISAQPQESTRDVQRQASRFEAFQSSALYQTEHLRADAWCAAFVWKKTARGIEPLHEETFRLLERAPERLPQEQHHEIRRLAAQYRFFHWHLAFPDVFRVPGPDETPDHETAGWSGGFDCVLGNPPWEHVEIKDKEFFAASRPDIAEAPTTAARQRMIDALRHEDPALHHAFLEAKRQSEGERSLISNSEIFPLCARGRINTYAIFAERFTYLTAPSGRAGVIVPSGIATDSSTQFFFRMLTESDRLASLYDFENRKKIFPAVDSRMKFCLLTVAGPGGTVREGAEYVFFAETVQDLRDAHRRFRLSGADIALLNPNTRTCSIFRSQTDAELTKYLYRRVPVLIEEGPPERNPWGITFRQGLFNMSSDSHLFRTREELERDGFHLEGNHFVREDGEKYLPLYEAKLFHQYDHRFATYTPSGSTRDTTDQEHANPEYVSIPRYWVAEAEVGQKVQQYTRDWFIAFRDICRSTDERTAIFSIIPRSAVGNNAPVIIHDTNNKHKIYLAAQNTSSFVFDYCTRISVGGTHLNFFIAKQLPVLPPEVYERACPWSPHETVAEWLLPRVIELTYTSWDMAPFARDVGYSGPPFGWDEERRALLRAELDAAYFHLYLGTAADWERASPALRQALPHREAAVAYILDTFPIVRRKDQAQHGQYATQERIIEVWRAMEEMARVGTPP